MSNNPEGPQILFVPAERIVARNKPSERTRLRCEHALRLLRGDKKKYDAIAVSGGLFESAAVQTVPAGVLMAEWFESNAVDPGLIVTEDKAHDSYENADGVVTALTERGFGDPKTWRMTVVTQRQHARRFAITFRAVYGVNIEVEAVDYPFGPFEWLKEQLFIFIHWVDPAGTWFLGPVNR